MTDLADTSVLVAASLAKHPRHQVASRWLEQQQHREWWVAGHTLIELYSVLTRLPGSPRLSPEAVRRIIQQNVLNTASVVTLSNDDYIELIAELEATDTRGGRSYDAVIYRAACKAKVDRLLTFNLDDFNALARPDGPQVASP